MCLVNDDGIRVGDIESGLNNGGGDEYIKLMINEFEHDVFQIIPFQLPMSDTYPSFGNKFTDHHAELWQVGNPVVDKENLAAAIQFELHGLFNQRFIEHV